MAQKNWFRRRSLFAAPVKPPAVPPRREWKLFRVLGTAFRRTCTAVGAMILVPVLFGLLLSGMFADKLSEPLPEQMVLVLSLKENYAEHQSIGSYGFGGGETTLRQAIDALDHARNDNRVKGLMAIADGAVLNIAQLQELREAVERFKAGGKFAYIYSESYGDQGHGMGGYYFASAFDKIYMQPMGFIAIPGVRAEQPFVRGLFDFLGVEPQFFARKEYKDVFETFTGAAMTPASREALGALIDDLATQMAGGIAQGRKMTPEAVRKLVDQGIFTDTESTAAGLVDELAYFDVLQAKIRKDVTGDPESEDLKFTKFNRYVQDSSEHQEISRFLESSPEIALVYVVGEIMPTDEAASASMYESEIVGADHIAADIRKAVRDEDIKAIVVRIDSPGGSPTASETIRRALIFAKEKKKPVIVSMGGMAASGGYWIASAGDYIFAMPGTLTGSIGVAGGKFVLQDLWKKIGVNWDGAGWGDNAGIWSFNTPYTQPQTERMNRMMDSIYEGFTARVAEGRRMTPDQVERVARGRVWSGAAAKNNGLVDEIGGLTAALDYAAKKAGAKDRSGISLEILPEPVDPFEKILDLMEGQVRAGEYLSSLSFLRPAVRAMERIQWQDGRPASYEALRVE